MIKIVINKKEMKSYKNFYSLIYKKLKAETFGTEFEEKDFGYDPNQVDEILWYYRNDNLIFILIGFDLEKIKLQKTHEDYRWNIIIETLMDFVNEYPNNTIEFVDKILF